MYAEVLPQWRTLYIPGRHGSPEFPGFTETKALLSSYCETKASPSEAPQLKGLRKENSRPRCGSAVSSEQLSRGRERKKVSAFATLEGGDYSILSFRTQAIFTVKEVSPWWPDCVTGGYDKSGSRE